MGLPRAKRASHRRRKRAVGPISRDRHRLYEISVQSPEEHIKFFERVFRKNNGRLPRILKEDFCGTAYLSAEWVRARPENRAIGVDLDRKTLAWAKENNIAPLGEDTSRIKLICADVRKVRLPRVDIVAALNFSFFIFKRRDELVGYFESARKSLKRGGMLVLDVFGGWEAQMEVTDKTRYYGFTYLWEQKRFDPITNDSLFYIHFRFHGGGGIRRAFEYDWRLWTLPELREALEEAGFGSVDVYWEGLDSQTREGNGVFRAVRTAKNCPGWIAFIVATRE